MGVIIQHTPYTFRQWDERACGLALHEGQNITVDEITGYCRGRMASYKIPKDIIFIKDYEMPRSAIGKILHRVLREIRRKDSIFKENERSLKDGHS